MSTMIKLTHSRARQSECSHPRIGFRMDKIVLKLEVVLTGAISPFAMYQTWSTSPRFWNGSLSVRIAPRALGRIARLVVNERIVLVLINIVKE